MLNDIIKSMEERFNRKNAVNNIERFMKTNQLTLITNSVGNTRLLAKTLNGNIIRKYLNDLGVSDLNEYIDKYYTNKNNNYDRR